MLTEEGFQSILDAIYFAAHEEQGWQKCLDMIAAASGSDSAQMLFFKSPMGALLSGFDSCPGNGSNAAVGAHAFEASHENEGLIIHLVLQRLSESTAYSDDEKDIIHGLLPHVARAVKQEHASKILNDRQAAVHQQGQGMLLLLDERLNVTFRSAEAEALLEKNLGLLLHEGKLKLARRVRHQELEAIVQRCARQGRGGIVTLTYRSQAPLRLLVTAVQYRDGGLFSVAGQVALFIVGELTQKGPNPGFVSEWLGLTEAESRIATLISQGRRPVDIAAETQSSVHTVRHHIKSIYRKTGTNSQSQLTALVLSLSA